MGSLPTKAHTTNESPRNVVTTTTYATVGQGVTAAAQSLPPGIATIVGIGVTLAICTVTIATLITWIKGRKT